MLIFKLIIEDFEDSEAPLSFYKCKLIVSHGMCYKGAWYTLHNYFNELKNQPYFAFWWMNQEKLYN